MEGPNVFVVVAVDRSDGETMVNVYWNEKIAMAQHEALLCRKELYSFIGYYQRQPLGSWQVEPRRM